MLAFLAFVSQWQISHAVLSEVALFSLRKKRTLRLHGNTGILSAAKRIFYPYGLHVSGFVSVSRCLGGTWSELIYAENMPSDKSKDETMGEVVTISRDKSICQDLAEAEKSDSHAAGLLLDYPSCCIDAMQDVEPAAGAWPKSLLDKTNGQAKAEANRLPMDWGGLSPIGEMFPCSLDCEHACRIGKESVHSLRRLGLARLADMVVSHATAWFFINAEGRAILCDKSKSNAQRLLWTG